MPRFARAASSLRPIRTCRALSTIQSRGPASPTPRARRAPGEVHGAFEQQGGAAAPLRGRRARRYARGAATPPGDLPARAARRWPRPSRRAAPARDPRRGPGEEGACPVCRSPRVAHRTTWAGASGALRYAASAAGTSVAPGPPRARAEAAASASPADAATTATGEGGVSCPSRRCDPSRAALN